MSSSSTGFVVLALFVAAAAVQAHNLKIVFKVEDCDGHPVQDAEVTMYGCVTGTEATIKTNKTGYAASSGGVTYCGTHSDWGCSWTAHKGNTWYNPSQSSLEDQHCNNTSPRQYSGCDCDPKSSCSNSEKAYHKVIVFKPRDCPKPNPKDCEGHWKELHKCTATCTHPKGNMTEVFNHTHRVQPGGKHCEAKHGERRTRECKKHPKECMPRSLGLEKGDWFDKNGSRLNEGHWAGKNGSHMHEYAGEHPEKGDWFDKNGSRLEEGHWAGKNGSHMHEYAGEHPEKGDWFDKNGSRLEEGHWAGKNGSHMHEFAGDHPMKGHPYDRNGSDFEEDHYSGKDGSHMHDYAGDHPMKGHPYDRNGSHADNGRWRGKDGSHP